ncbi:Hypothetical predicted protein, partial [Drosophila guanche]
MHSSSQSTLKRTQQLVRQTNGGRGDILSSGSEVVHSSRGPPITTNIDDSSLRYRHETKRERTVEAVITDYPGTSPLGSVGLPHERTNFERTVTFQDAAGNGRRISESRALVPSGGNTAQAASSSSSSSYQQVTRNKRISTEVLGSSVESTKTSQRAPNGHRRVTTHIVRKVTTLSRAEENAQPAEDLLPPAKMIRSSELEYRRALPAPLAIESSSTQRRE